jgi:hypothetical protein
MWMFYQFRRFIALQVGTLDLGEATPPVSVPTVKMTHVLPADPEKQAQVVEKF